jgi:hypothetical protein
MILLNNFHSIAFEQFLAGEKKSLTRVVFPFIGRQYILSFREVKARDEVCRLPHCRIF